MTYLLVSVILLMFVRELKMEFKISYLDTTLEIKGIKNEYHKRLPSFKEIFGD